MALGKVLRHQVRIRHRPSVKIKKLYDKGRELGVKEPTLLVYQTQLHHQLKDGLAGVRNNAGAASSRKRIESNYKNLKRTSIAESQFQRLKADEQAGSDLPTRMADSVFEVQNRKKFPTGKQLSLKQASTPEFVVKMRSTGGSLLIHKGQRKLEGDGSASPS